MITFKSMATYTITLNTPETRVYIYPPFTKPVKYIELLECYAPSGWYTLKNAKIVLPETVNDTETSDLEDGSYSPKAFQKLINSKGTPKLYGCLMKERSITYILTFTNLLIFLIDGL